MCASQSAVFRRRYALGVWFHTLKKNGVLLFVAENGISCLNLTTPKIQATFGGKVSNSWPKKNIQLLLGGSRTDQKYRGFWWCLPIQPPPLLAGGSCPPPSLGWSQETTRVPKRLNFRQLQAKKNRRKALRNICEQVVFASNPNLNPILGTVFKQDGAVHFLKFNAIECPSAILAVFCYFRDGVRVLPRFRKGRCL